MKNSLYQFFIPNEENHFRPTSLESRSFVVYIAIALLLKLGIMSFFSALPKTTFFADVTRTTLVALTNDARVANGLKPLTENETLQKAAQEKAQDILSKGYFAHQSPDGKTPWYWFLQVGYKYLYAGENLAMDYVESSDVVSAWLNSPGHRANIENPNYQDIGIAVVQGKFGSEPGDSRIVVVQLFGKAVPSPSPVVSPSNPPKPPVAMVAVVTPAPTPRPSPKATEGAAKPTPKPTPAVTPKPTPKPTSIPSASPIVSVTPAPSAQPSASQPSTLTPSPTPNPTRLAVSASPTSTVGAVLGFAQLPLGEAPSAHTAFYARVVSSVGTFSETVFYAFLAFVVLVSLLNIFIRRDIQHTDLLVRAVVLTLFFVVMIATRHQTFLDLFPQVL